ncbi:MAG: heat-inducible transcription repressor HrcA [Clostridia bacterium]|nr:heat-inducible transcription repressor HrcA [Clostridia bacterium]
MLDNRKKQILQAIVDNYIDTAEPVGSRTIEKKYQLGLSSATIRNEMADLEELGYLMQPHTSAGRVPSLTGYQLYVDELMTQYSLTLEEIGVLKSVMEEKFDYLEKIISKASGIMSDLTNYTSVVMGPKIKKDSIKNIRLIPVDSQIILAVIVTNEGIIKDKKIRLRHISDFEGIERLEKAINSHLAGIESTEITMDRVVRLVNEAKVSDDITIAVLEFIKECITSQSKDDLYVNGSANILAFPEYSDVSKAKDFLNFVGDKENMMLAISQSASEAGDISIKIGGQDGNADYSIITSKYKIGDSMEGVIGLIGPVRMDYKKAVSVMKSVTDMINNKMLEITKKEDGHE